MIALLVGLAAAAALTPLWLLLMANAKAPLRALAPAGFAILVAIAAAAATPAPAAPPADRPLAQRGDGYVGSGACRSCHPGEHASWHASFHRTMTQPCTPDTLVADLGPSRRVDLDFHGRPVALQWQGDQLWVELDEPAPRGPARRVRREVVQLTGSHHAQVLWYSTGEQRQLGAVPMVWRIAERRWLPVDAVFLMPPGIDGPPAPGTWNGNCMACHVTHAMPRLDVGRTDTLAAEFGIACEACHGPGGAHAAANANPLRRYALHFGGEGDPTVTEPRRLDARRQSEVCGQCHSVSIVRRPHFDSWREKGSPYRPGQPLDEAQLVVTPGAAGAVELRGQLQRDPSFFRNTFWPDGQVRATGREFNGLLASPCHARGGEHAMTCLSCHGLHQREGDGRPRGAWADCQLLPGMDGDAACVQCHPRFADPAAKAAHSRHESIGCYDCHMPRTAWGLLAAQRSHAVDSPGVRSELANGRPNACNLCHLDRTLAWTNERLRDWYGIEPAPLDGEAATIAAGVLWLLAGDAAQRVLAADAAGRASAQRAAGTGWMAPFLGQLLADPYFAVRLVAERSLRSIGAAPPEGYDFLAAGPQVRNAAASVQDAWAAAWRGNASRPEVLVGGRGLAREAFARLLARRDDRPIQIAE